MTDDLIRRQDAITIPVIPKEHRKYQTMNLDDVYESGWFDCQKCIEDLPSAQPERKHGKWKIKTINTFDLAYGSTGYEPVYECSVCGAVEESYLRLDEPIMPEDADFPNYCPNCGADMRGDQK